MVAVGHQRSLAATAGALLAVLTVSRFSLANRSYGEAHYAGAEIIGLSRGLYVEVSTVRTNGVKISATDIDMLVNLFNDQVRKLEAA